MSVNEFIGNITKNGIPAVVLLAVAGALLVYGLAWLWSVATGRQLWDNLYRTRRLSATELGRPSQVPLSGSTEETTSTLVLSRSNMPIDLSLPDNLDANSLIYPVAGRTGINFEAERCTGCGLCAYVCPTNAVSTDEVEGGYLRKFDLQACVFCGLCESACATFAIRLTVGEQGNVQPEESAVVQGMIPANACQTCRRLVPQTDLLAARLYSVEVYDYPGGGLNKKATKQRLNAVSTSEICFECQQRVLETEDKICG